jgi:hypothetical protein
MGPRGGYGSFSLWVIHKEGLCLSCGGINRLMMMMTPEMDYSQTVMSLPVTSAVFLIALFYTMYKTYLIHIIIKLKSLLVCLNALISGGLI